MRSMPVASMGGGVARPTIVADARVDPLAAWAGQAAESIHEARARRQLDVIATTTKDFVRAGIVHWLIGGWAVDFHLGRRGPGTTPTSTSRCGSPTATSPPAL